MTKRSHHELSFVHSRERARVKLNGVRRIQLGIIRKRFVTAYIYESVVTDCCPFYA
jgi:hypothetical protein